jgi:Flp pilus assembly protein TadD
MFRRGLTAMQARRSDEALRYWELVWSAEPSYPQVAEYLKRECLTRGMEAFAAGRLDEAVQFWQRAQRVDPQDPRAAGYLSRAQKQLARTREILGSSQ